MGSSRVKFNIKKKTTSVLKTRERKESNSGAFLVTEVSDGASGFHRSETVRMRPGPSREGRERATGKGCSNQFWGFAFALSVAFPVNEKSCGTHDPCVERLPIPRLTGGMRGVFEVYPRRGGETRGQWAEVWGPMGRSQMEAPSSETVFSSQEKTLRIQTKNLNGLGKQTKVLVKQADMSPGIIVQTQHE